MSQTTIELKNEIHKSLDLMRQLRDEIRLKVHLAGLETKEEWRKLEPRLQEVERAANELTEATRTTISETVKRLSKLRSSLS